MFLSGDSAADPAYGKPSAPQTPLTDTLSSLANTVLQVVSTGMQIKSQQDLARINMQRLQQGLQPINYNQIPGIVPTGQVQVGVDSGTQTALMLGLGAVAVVLLFGSLKKSGGSRRRYAHA